MIALLWARFSGYVAVVGAVLSMIGAVFLAGMRRERLDAERRRLKTEIRNVETREAVDRHVSRVADPADELRQRWRRD